MFHRVQSSSSCDQPKPDLGPSSRGARAQRKQFDEVEKGPITFLPPSRHGSMMDAIAPALNISQLFGVFPLYGINADSAHKISFRWKSSRSLYAIACLLGTTFSLLCAHMSLLKNGYEFKELCKPCCHFSVKNELQQKKKL